MFIPGLLVTISLAAAMPRWSSVDVLGWTKDGTAIAWSTTIESSESMAPDGPVGELGLTIVTDPRGEVRRVFRADDDVPPNVKWSVPGADQVWRAAEPHRAGEEWLQSHPLTAVSEEHPIGKKIYEDLEGREALRLSTSSSSGACPTLTLVAALGEGSTTVGEDRCEGGGARRHPQWGSTIRVSWSPDGTRAAVSWNVSRFTVAHQDVPAGETNGGHVLVVSRLTLASVDILDAGSGNALASLAARIEGAGFRVAHRGKAGTPRATTEVYFAPGFEPEAKVVAALAGAAADAVKPLSWKSPYAITVAAGGAAKAPRTPPARSRRRAAFRSAPPRS